MNRELRPHQVRAMEMLRASLANGCRRPLLQAPTGAGKTMIASAIVEGATNKGKRVIFTVPALSLVDQTVQALWDEGIRDIGVIQGRHTMTDWSKPVQVASVQTLMKREIPHADVVVVDECFAAGTMVRTPLGERPIDEIKIGDTVANAVGVGFVAKVFCKVGQIVRMRLSNGRTILVTDNHPFFTEDGWRRTRDMEVGSRLFSHEAMRSLRCGNAPMEQCEQGAIGGRLGRKAFLLRLLREEAGESHARPGRQRKNVEYVKGDWAPAESPGREWQNNCGASQIALSSRAGMGAGVRYPNEDGQGVGLSDVLQDRYWEQIAYDWDRNRWGESRFLECRESGQEENRPLGDILVEDISREECSSDRLVYNLEVTGHPSYFAEGVLVHNCHHWFDFYGKWFLDPAWAKRPFIGLSATPWTRGLGKYYDDLVIAATTAELIEAEYLAPFRVYAPSHPDLSGVRTVAGDYHEGDLSGVMNESPLVADVVNTWLQRAENRSTFCFAVDRAHAKNLQEKFQAAGVETGYIDAYTKLPEREQVERAFHDGRIRVVCNVGCLTTGIDWDVRCIILARPTKSEMLFVQIIGRGLRTAEGKDDCLILDHSDTHLRLGFVTDIGHDKLDDGRERVNAKPDKIRLPKECPECAFLKPPGSAVCPACGFKAQVVSKIKEGDGELAEFTGKKKAESRGAVDQLSFYLQLRGYAESRGYQKAHGWSCHKFKEKFGTWPPRIFEGYSGIEPTPTVLSWIRSRQIAFAKAREKAASHASAA